MEGSAGAQGFDRKSLFVQWKFAYSYACLFRLAVCCFMSVFVSYLICACACSMNRKQVNNGVFLLALSQAKATLQNLTTFSQMICVSASSTSHFLIPVSHPCFAQDDVCVWNSPIECHFAASAIRGWPKLFFEVNEEDELGRIDLGLPSSSCSLFVAPFVPTSILLSLPSCYSASSWLRFVLRALLGWTSSSDHRHIEA